MPTLTRSNLVLVAVTVAAWIAWGLYALMPVDLLPDLIPVLGWLDDLAGLSSVLGMTAFTVRRLLQSAPALEHPVYEPIPEAELRRL